MSEPDLEAINDRYEASARRWQGAESAIAAIRSANDVPVLLGAIDRLRSMLIDAETEAQMQAAEVERLRKADDIVRKLATSTWVYDTYVCIHCKSLVDDDEAGTMDEPHKDDCPHALALAYVEANPA